MANKIIVTGGAGFIGSNLVDALVNRGDDVIVIDNLLTGKMENVNPMARFIKADIRNLNDIRPIFYDVDYVFHTAAFPRIQSSIDNPIVSNQINLYGTVNVLIAARDAGAKRLIYSASSSAYGPQEILPWQEDMMPNPKSPYGLQKYISEIYCRFFSEVYNLSTVCLRYFNVYGFRQPKEGAYTPVLATFFKQRAEGKPMTILGDGEQSRDATNVFDVVQANLLAAESSRVGRGEVINIGRGVKFTVNEIAKMVSGPTINIPPRKEIKHSYSDNSRARELLGWEPKYNLPEWVEEYKRKMGLN